MKTAVQFIVLLPLVGAFASSNEQVCAKNGLTTHAPTIETLSDMANPSQACLPKEKNLSIWLVPGSSSPENEALSNVINILAKKYQRHPYTPHATLTMLPANFPLIIVNRVLEEMKGDLFKERVVFKSLRNTKSGIMLDGQSGNHLAELQKKWHVRLAEELKLSVERGELSEEDLEQMGVSMNVKNTVPRFPHFAIAYTNNGHQEGIEELEQRGLFKQSPLLEVGGYNGYKIGAIYAAYCGGLRPETWKVFMKLEDESEQLTL